MKKYRRKPAVIEAEQLTQEKIDAHFFDDLPLPKGVTMLHARYNRETREVRCSLSVTTIHGQPTPIVVGDWIMPEPDGIHFYPCKPDIFAATYENAE